MVKTAEAKWTVATRKAYHKDHPENFAGPDMSFPIRDKSDVGDAWGLAGHAADPDSVRAKIKAIAKRLGFTDALPDTAKDGDDKKESVSLLPGSSSTASTASFSRPKERIASIQVRWITDGARSLNGRIYPQETVSRLIASGQRKIAEGKSVTCFLSHADADNDNTPALIGKATNIWREGADGLAMIDLADTTQSKNALGLIVGKYICTESLRASNAELRTDSRYDVPIVGGDRIELDGIDLTNYPGLEAVARIQQVHIVESAQTSAQPLTEIFAIAPTALEIQTQPGNGQGGQSMSKSSLNEAMPPGGNTVGGYQPTSGEAPYMTNDPTKDAYGQRMYPTPGLDTPGPMQGMEPAPELMEAHDRVAMVQGRSCAPGKESARWKAAHAGLSLVEQADMALREAGRKISAKSDAHLDAAHDALAKHMGMACEGASNKMASKDPDNDGDDDSDPSKNPDRGLDQMESTRHKKGTSPMTEEEALKLLESRGYGVQKPKTEADLLKEQLAAMQAEQSREKEERTKQLEEMKALITQSQQVNQGTPQRRSQVLGATINEPANNQHRPLHGRYLQEKIRSVDWEQLADRTAPLPTDIPLDMLMREFEHMYAISYDDWAQRIYGIEPIYVKR